MLSCRFVLERTGATLWREYVVHVVGGVSLLLFTLSVMFDVSVLELKEDRCSRQDNLFIRKVRRQINHGY